MAKSNKKIKKMFSKKLQENVASIKKQYETVLEGRMEICEIATKMLTEGKTNKKRILELRDMFVKEALDYRSMCIMEALSQTQMEDLDNLVEPVSRMLNSGGPAVVDYLEGTLKARVVARAFKNSRKEGWTKTIPAHVEDKWLTTMAEFIEFFWGMYGIKDLLAELANSKTSDSKAMQNMRMSSRGASEQHWMDIPGVALIRRKLQKLARIGVEPDKFAESFTKMSSEELDGFISELEHIKETSPITGIVSRATGGSFMDKVKSVGKSLGSMLSGWGHSGATPSPVGLSSPSEPPPRRRLFGR